jgi:probable F420-dependent oxidoreductase
MLLHGLRVDVLLVQTGRGAVLAVWFNVSDNVREEDNNMHLGFSTMNTPEDPDPRDLAKLLEAAGFESLWTGEHSHIPLCRTTPYPAGGELPQPYTQMRDPYVALMAAACATSTLKLGTSVALLMERELFSQAKTIATLDLLSGGRLMIGAGVGWNEEEFNNVGSAIPWRKRYRGLEETVAATRALFTDAAAEYHGEFIDFDPVCCEPKPLPRDDSPSGPMAHRGPPILLGAMGPVGIGHAARWADGWIPVDVAMMDIPGEIASFRRQVSEHGRNPDSVDITMVVMSEVNRELLLRYRDYGVNRVIVGVGMENWNKPEMIEPMVEMCAGVIPEL